MTAVNEHLNRQNLASNCGQQILSNDNELFCLSNALVSPDCRSHSSTLNQNGNQQQFHSNQQALQHNLTSSPGISSDGLQSGNCLNSKKCDLNNNTINGNGERQGLIGGKTGRTLNRPNGSLESTESQVNCSDMNSNNSGINLGAGGMMADGVHHLHVQRNPSNESHQHHQSEDYSERNLINKSSSLGHSLTVEDANCQPSYAHQTLHLSHQNHLNHLGHPLNGNSVNKLGVSGRRGRPPKKDSKSRNRQSRGKSERLKLLLAVASFGKRKEINLRRLAPDE